MLLFCSSATMWAFVIPTGSMENTLLVGDHLIVDKLAYAPPGSLSKHLLPYTEVKRGDVIVFQYPLDIRQDYVKRAIGIPGDRIHILNKQVFVNGKRSRSPTGF
jgi:signal peptidase I, bacterial type